MEILKISTMPLDGKSNMKRLLIPLLACFMFVGCATTSEEKSTSNDAVVATLTSAKPHPTQPDWVTFTRKPVIKSYDVDGKKNYEVSDQFIERSLQLQNYKERIDSWKKENLIP